MNGCGHPKGHEDEKETETEDKFSEIGLCAISPHSSETRKCLSQSQNIYAWRYEVYTWSSPSMEDMGEKLIHEVEKIKLYMTSDTRSIKTGWRNMTSGRI